MKKLNGFMHGINLGGWLSQCTSYSKKHYCEFITENDIETIAGWGLDHVRLPIDYNVIEKEDGSPDENGYQYVDNCIMWCKKHGMNVVLDLHSAKGFSFDKNLDDNTLFNDSNLQDRFINLWKNISARYGKYNNIAFELLNEVVEDDSSRWNRLVQRTIAEIRCCAPGIKIIVGGIHWNSVHTLRLLECSEDENIVYNFHFYEPFLFTHQHAPWQPLIADKSIRYRGNIEIYREESQKINCFGSGLYNTDKMGTEFMEKLIAEAVEAAEKAKVPLYCGEYGVIDRADIEDTVQWYEDIHDVFEKFGIGRAAWTYKGIDFGISESHYAQGLNQIITCL